MMEKRSRDCVTAWLKSYQGVERSSSTGERRIPQHHEGGRDQQQVVIINVIANVIINVIINAMAYSHHDNFGLPRCSGSLGSRGSRAESVYEMGDDYSDHEQVERKRKEVEQ